jgi:hypothetical protein
MAVILQYRGDESPLGIGKLWIRVALRSPVDNEIEIPAGALTVGP